MILMPLILILLFVPLGYRVLKKYKLSSESHIFLGYMSSVSLLYIGGICNVLLPVYYIITACLLLSFVFLVVNSFINIDIGSLHIKKTSLGISNLFTPGICLFLAANVLYVFFYLSFDEELRSWDEFSYWAGNVKQAFFFDCFKNAEIIYSKSKAGLSYPPGNVMEAYWFGRILKVIKPSIDFEYLLYCGRFFLLTVCYLPFAGKIKWKNAYLLLPFVFIVYFIPSWLERHYLSLYVDFGLGVLAASAFGFVFMEKLYGRRAFLAIPVLIFLVTYKVSGIFLAYLVVAFIVYGSIIQLCGLAKRKKRSSRKADKRQKWSYVLRAILFFIVILTPYLTSKSWQIYRDANNILRESKGENDYLKTMQVLINKREFVWKQAEIYKNFKSYLKYDYYAQKSLSALFWFIGGILILVVPTFWMVKKKKIKLVVGLAVILTLGGVFYGVGLLTIYFFKFSEYEAVRCASMHRYLETVMVLASLCSTLPLLSSVNKREKIRNFTFWLLILTLTVSFVPLSLKLRYTTRSAVKPIKQLTAKVMDKIKEYPAKQVFFIWQKSQGFHYLAFRYYAYPYAGFYQYGNGSIGTKTLYEGDIWTKIISPDKLTFLLYSYDFVVVAEADETFWDSYGKLFVKGKSQDGIYKVLKEPYSGKGYIVPFQPEYVCSAKLNVGKNLITEDFKEYYTADCSKELKCKDAIFNMPEGWMPYFVPVIDWGKDNTATKVKIINEQGKNDYYIYTKNNVYLLCQKPLKCHDNYLLKITTGETNNANIDVYASCYLTKDKKKKYIGAQTFRKIKSDEKGVLKYVLNNKYKNFESANISILIKGEIIIKKIELAPFAVESTVIKEQTSPPL